MGIAGLFTIFLAAAVAAVGIWTSASSATTSLATFNLGFVPFYPGVTGPEIEERTELLIQQVWKIKK
jgi:hypothetical protein